MANAIAIQRPVEHYPASIPEPEILPPLFSIAKTVRQLVSLKLADIEMAAGQEQLLLCFEDDETFSISRIADRLSVRASTISKMTDILERKGWVGRHSDGKDARRVLVQLTARGQQKRDVVRTLQEELDAELWHLLGKDDEIIPALAKLDAVLNQRLRRLR